ncbi:MAG: hypothetical protein AAGE76_09830 [Pseudomonadota bacterium]
MAERRLTGGHWMLLAAGIASPRLMAWALGWRADPGVVLGHWQHADLALLAEAPWQTLWLLHAQPPGWNGILALAAAWAGPDPAAAAAFVHIAFTILSALAGAALAAAAVRFGVRPWLAVLGVVLVLASPSVLYYERYVFYPHLTWVLIAALIWLLARGSMAAMAVPVALAWIWALFHPAFVVLWGAVFWLTRRRGGAWILGGVLLAALPTVHNLTVFQVPSASSWVGLNLVQTAPGLTVRQRQTCDFYLFQRGLAPGTGPEVLAAVRKRAGPPNLNHAALIDRARICQHLALRAIRDDPAAYLAGRLTAVAKTHGVRPFEYAFGPAKPPALRAMETWAARIRPLSQAFYAVCWLWLLILLRGPHRGAFALLALVAFWVTFAGHFANGTDQERMRYTIEPIYALLALLVAERFISAAGFRQNRPPDP